MFSPLERAVLLLILVFCAALVGYVGVSVETTTLIILKLLGDP